MADLDDPITHDDLLRVAAEASHFLDPSRFLDVVAERHHLGPALAPADVLKPAPGEPRGGGYPIDAELGVLAELPGSWSGNGFNLIARPAREEGRDFFLELNATKENLTFTPISGPIPNRGSEQDDISFLGLTYLQRVSDAVTSGGLHIEPGIWINVPATKVPDAPASVVRLANIPHGNSLLAQGSGFEVAGGPVIGPASSTPIDEKTGAPPARLGYLDPFLVAKPPAPIPPAAVANPNLVLSEAIEGQKFSKTVVLTISTEPAGGIENIPFLVKNADAVSLTAIFWIETIELPGGATRLQLQYTQTVALSFLGIKWPHVSVATLLKL
jgi:hypothetical protein